MEPDDSFEMIRPVIEFEIGDEADIKDDLFEKTKTKSGKRKTSPQPKTTLPAPASTLALVPASAAGTAAALAPAPAPPTATETCYQNFWTPAPFQIPASTTFAPNPPPAPAPSVPCFHYSFYTDPTTSGLVTSDCTRLALQTHLIAPRQKVVKKTQTAYRKLLPKPPK